MAAKSTKDRGAGRRMRGFERTGSLLATRIRKAGEGRGFAVTRLLTHWAEIAGEDMASVTRPVRISYGRGGIGATLTVLTTGAQAPIVAADLPKLKDRVNACYGYAAISQIRITQTAPQGFAEGQASFDHRPVLAAPITASDPERADKARAAADGVADTHLRAALEDMGAQIFSRPKK